MTHLMNLYPEPFEMINSGAKTYELRLYDEKRRLINVGDTNTKTNEQITVLVKNLHNLKALKSFMQPCH